LRGALVRTLVDEVRPAGEGQAVWDGKNAQGAQAASGVYFYEARTGDEVQIRKMALVK
jgi:flagellar hook assembly protein FlgD